jgi:hypothetical protein
MSDGPDTETADRDDLVERVYDMFGYSGQATEWLMRKLLISFWEAVDLLEQEDSRHAD